MGDTEQPSKKKKGSKKKMNIKNIVKKSRKQLFKSVWGTRSEKYNLVTSTQVFANFLTLQIMRLLSFIALFIVFASYIYIYLRQAFGQYTFWALSATLVSFGFLFIGSGK